MGLETATYIGDLNALNPTSGDLISAGDDHIRLLKSVLKSTFPNLTGAVTPTQTELNFLVGVTAGVQAQLDTKTDEGHTHSEAEIEDGGILARLGATEQVTGTWTFDNVPVFVQGIDITSGGPSTIHLDLSSSGASTPVRALYGNEDWGANQKYWLESFYDTVWQLEMYAEIGATPKRVMSASRSGNILQSLFYGNADDNPSHYFYGNASFYDDVVITGTLVVGGVAVSTAGHTHDDRYPVTESGSFTAALRSSPGGSNLATGTAYWQKIGKQVTLRLPPTLYVSGNYSGTFMYVAGLPASIQPSIGGGHTQQQIVPIFNTNAWAAGVANINNAASYVTLWGTTAGGYFGASGSNGLPTACISLIYQVSD